jgi:type I restriction enzyme R subunit
VGTGASHEEKIELSQLIDILNEHLGTDFKPADQLFFDSICEDAVSDTNLRQAAMANTMENFGYVFLKALDGLFIDRIDQNEEIAAKFINEKEFQKKIAAKFINEKEFQKIAGQNLLERVYKQIRAEEASA